MFCPKCGTDNYEQVRHCKSCRMDLGVVHLAIAGRLPDLTTVMTEEKRRRMQHRGLIGTIAGTGFSLLFTFLLVTSLAASGSTILFLFSLIALIMLGLPLLAYGVGSLISSRFIYRTSATDYTQRFDVVRDMLEVQSTDSYPSVSSFTGSVIESRPEEPAEPARPRPERERQ